MSEPETQAGWPPERLRAALPAPANAPPLGSLPTCSFLLKHKVKSRTAAPGWGFNIQSLLLRKTPLETKMVHSSRAQKADGRLGRSERCRCAPRPVTLDGTIRKGHYAPSVNPRPRLEYSHSVGRSVGTICHVVDKRGVDFFLLMTHNPMSCSEGVDGRLWSQGSEAVHGETAVAVVTSLPRQLTRALSPSPTQ